MSTQKRTVSEFAEPGMGTPAQGVALPQGQTDREGAMAKADLFKMASYANKLHSKIQDNDQLESWVQAKITKAADYITSVYHYLEYEMKVTEFGRHLDDSDTLSEGQKAALKGKLMEAKAKVRELKVAQAEKVKEAKSPKAKKDYDKDGKIESEKDEVIGSRRKAAGLDETKVEDHHTDLVHAAAIVAGLKRRANAPKTPKAAPMATDMEAGMDLDDESVMGADSPLSAAPRSVHPAAKQKLETYGKKTRAMAAAVKRINDSTEEEVDEDSMAGPVSEDANVDQQVLASYEKEYQTAKGYDKVNLARVITALKQKMAAQPIQAAPVPAMQEGKPSAGLSKAKKSATVKKAKAGGDIGKPGKGFDKLAKKAGGGEKGEKIAAAAMWKNIKETTAYMMEKAEAAKKADKDYDKDGEIETGAEEHAGSVDKAIKASKSKETMKESTDLNRMKSLMTRLNG